MKNYHFLILYFLIISCSNKTPSENSTTYDDYKIDQIIVDSLNKTDNCGTKIKLAQQLKTIDFIRQKAQAFDDCGGKTINNNIEHANDKVINRLNSIFEKDQEVRNQVYDSLGNDYTFKELSYYIKKYGNKIDSLSYLNFDKLVDSIGEWPGVKYVPRKPYYPKTEILVAHFPEKGYVKYVKIAINAAHHNEEFWGKIKQLVEYSTTKPNPILWTKSQKYVFPFRFMEFKKNGTIDENSELTVLDLENISNRQYVNNGCQSSTKFQLSSSLPQKKDRKKLLEQAKAILLKQGVKESEIILDFSKQHDYMNYKLFFKDLCT